MAGETQLQISPSSTAATGPVSVGANFTPSFFSPFAVGRGATATASDYGDGSAASSTPLILAVIAGALLIGGAIFLSRQRSRR